jgi:ribosome-binding factor A
MVTTIPDGSEADALIFLKRNASEMRNYFKKHGRFKTIPHLDFMIDVGEKHRQNMDDLVRDIANGTAT